MHGQPGPHIRVIKTETLSELVPVISAPNQLRDLPGKKEEQAKRVEEIVEEPDHQATRSLPETSTRCRNNTSVAPYFLARVTFHNGVGAIFSAGRFSKTKNPDPSSIPASSVLSSKSWVNSPP